MVEIVQPDIVGAYARGLQTRHAMQQIQDEDRERAAKEQLRALFARPGFDASKPESLRQVGEYDPSLMLSLQKNQLANQKAQAELSAERIKAVTSAAKGAYAEWKQLPETQRQNPDIKRRLMEGHLQLAGQAIPTWDRPIDEHWGHLVGLATMDSVSAESGYFEPRGVKGPDGKVTWMYPGKDGKFLPTGMEKPPETSVILTDRGYVAAPKVPGAPAAPVTTADGKGLFAKPDQKLDQDTSTITTIPQAGSGQAPTVTQVQNPVLSAQAQKTYELQKEKYDILEKTTQDLLKHPGLSGLAGVSGTTPNFDFPGGDTFNARRTLETLKAQIGFGELQAMRDASKTGGALGQVAVQELEGLQNSLAALQPGQGEEQLKDNLRAVLRHIDVLKRIMAANSPLANTGQQPAGSGSAPPQRPPITQKDLEFTARKRGKTVEQVKRDLGIQ